MKVLITDGIEKACGNILKEAGFQIDEKAKLTKDELKAIIAGYDVLLVRSATKVTAEILDAATNLKLIGRAGEGVDNIDTEAATRKGVIVMNTPGGNTISAAEHACAMLMSAARLIPQAHGETVQGIWDKKKWIGAELYGKTLGVLGLGKIGREVATRMKGFDMNIIAYDPRLPKEIAAKANIELMSVEEVLKQSDFITIHTPLNDETRNLINKNIIPLMKDGVRIVNCARGGVVNEADLIAALASGKVAAAAFDVFMEEPLGKDNPMLTAKNMVLTPHIAASTKEAQERVAIQLANQIRDWKHVGKVAGAVNAMASELAANPEIKNYLTLAEKLGSLGSQLISGKLKTLTLTLSGPFLAHFAEALTTATLKGTLDALKHEKVNYVNAAVMAAGLGLTVKQIREKENPDFAQLITLTLESDSETRKFAGTVFGQKEMRIVKLDNYLFDVKPEGNILFYTNEDRPGVLARVGLVLLNGNINIANLALSRDEEKKNAMTVIATDEKISESLLVEIGKIAGVFKPKVVEL
jgi:D-3-phosphoglycerate dehydrogenase